MEMIGFLGRGIDHERRGLPCQDALGGRVCGNGCRVYAVADGASSASFAGEAAGANVAAVLDYFETKGLGYFLGLEPEQRSREILDACSRELCLVRERLGADWVHLSATLLFFVCDGERWAAGHLGDGVILVQSRDGEGLLYSEPENAGRRSATYFTVSPDAAEHLRIHTGGPDRSPGRALVMSDGPCNMFLTRNGSVRETAEELLGYVGPDGIATAEDLADALDQMTVYAFDRMDDWSVVLWSADAPFSGTEEIRVQSMLQREERRSQAPSDDGAE